MMIRFKLAVVEDILGKLLETIKAVIIKDDTELCTVGFLGTEVAALPSQKIKCIENFAHVLELVNDTHENSTMRKKSNRDDGIASFRLMDDIRGQKWILL